MLCKNDSFGSNSIFEISNVDFLKNNDEDTHLKQLDGLSILMDGLYVFTYSLVVQYIFTAK